LPLGNNRGKFQGKQMVRFTPRKERAWKKGGGYQLKRGGGDCRLECIEGFRTSGGGAKWKGALTRRDYSSERRERASLYRRRSVSVEERYFLKEPF